MLFLKAVLKLVPWQVWVIAVAAPFALLWLHTRDNAIRAEAQLKLYQVTVDSLTEVADSASRQAIAQDSLNQQVIDSLRARVAASEVVLDSLNEEVPVLQQDTDSLLAYLSESVRPTLRPVVAELRESITTERASAAERIRLQGQQLADLKATGQLQQERIDYWRGAWEAEKQARTALQEQLDRSELARKGTFAHRATRTLTVAVIASGLTFAVLEAF